MSIQFSLFVSLSVFALCLQRRGCLKISLAGNSLAVQWLGLRAPTAGGPSSIPGWGTKIPQAAQRGQKKKRIKKKITLKYILTAIRECLSESSREHFKNIHF